MLSFFDVAADASTVASPPPWVTVLVAFFVLIGSLGTALGPHIYNKRKENKGTEEPRTAPIPPPPVVAPDGSIAVEPTIMRLLNTVGVIQARQEDSDKENKKLREQLFQLQLRFQYSENQHYQSLQQILTWAENNTTNPIPVWVRDIVVSAQKAATEATPSMRTGATR